MNGVVLSLLVAMGLNEIELLAQCLACSICSLNGNYHIFIIVVIIKGYPSAISPSVVSKYSSQRNMMKKITNIGSARKKECFISNKMEKTHKKNKEGNDKAQVNG